MLARRRRRRRLAARLRLAWSALFGPFDQHRAWLLKEAHMAGVDAAIRRWHLEPPIEEVCELGRRAHRRYGSRRWT